MCYNIFIVSALIVKEEEVKEKEVEKKEKRSNAEGCPMSTVFVNYEMVMEIEKEM